MISYIENPKYSARTLLDIINKFGKSVGYKINVQNSVVFLYTHNELSKKEMKKMMLFAIAS